ncbi:MAG: glycoside hydrolase family 13 protein [Woeseiaceae bacterium]
MMRLFADVLAALAASLIIAAASDASPRPERVEPPGWWIGFSHDELQVLVYGEGIAAFEPALEYPGVSIERVLRVENPDYLFIYVRIDPQTSPGTFDIAFRRPGQTLTWPYTLAKRNEDPAHARGFSAADAIYLITPDRFANGDPANDHVGGYEDRPDRQDPGGRHGGDLQGIADHLDYIGDLGFTAIWLNPVLENAMPARSYHGYATTDFYRVDPRFGSNDDFRALVAAARSRGIGVIMDMIVNHSGSEHWWMKDLPTADWINFPDEYVQTSHQRTTWQDPYSSQYDRTRFADGWFVRTMPDLNQRNPLLADYLTQNALWWIEYLGLAGIRMDTWPYADRHFMAKWTRRIMEEYPEFNIVGEEWSLNPAIVSYWQRGKINHDGYVSYLPSLLDFPLREALKSSLLADEPAYGSSWEPLYVMLANDFLYPEPQSLVIFPDNHDMSRIYTQLGEDDELFRMAMAYTLTMRGIPQLYYGTEILMKNPGTEDHGVIRSDFPGGWRGDRVDAFTGKGLEPGQREARAWLRNLLHWRRKTPVVQRGALMHYNPIGPVYVYFRYDDEDTVMVAFNKSREPVQLDTARFSERLVIPSRARDVTADRTIDIGDTLALAPRSVMVLEIE